MRIRRLYQVYDLKAEIVIGHPYVELRDEAAIRIFHSLLADPQLVLGKNPGDYDLRAVAIQDELTGQITGSKTIDIIETGMHWLSVQREDREKDSLKDYDLAAETAHTLRELQQLRNRQEHAELTQPD